MANEIWYADVNFLGESGVIAAGVIDGPGGLAIVDPGPSATLEGLRQALLARGRRIEEVRAILVTHIHLDHSGSAGTIAREAPDVRVFVHERGAPHVVDPAKLVASAQRIYGDQMDRLWGEVLPVPATRVEALAGGETLDIVGRPMRVAYTPGHAVHHVCYLDEASGVAFTGDVGGMVLGGAPVPLPPTPPPDIDLERWHESLVRIRAWNPTSLLLAHFGLVTGVAAHLDDLETRLRAYAAAVRETLETEAADDKARIARFREAVLGDLRRLLPAGLVAPIERAYHIDDNWVGLARYWRKRWERERIGIGAPRA